MSDRCLAPEPTTESSRPSRPWACFARGLGLGMPIFLGYLAVGLAFGVLARQLGFSVFEAVACSATALAGAGQFIALSLMKAGATPAATLIATGVVNLRYLLFGTTISPYLRGTRLLPQSWLAFTLTDETFAVNIADRRRKESTVASMAGVGAISWAGWVLGTLAGAAGATWIGDPERWGMGFAMPAMFSALFVALADDKRHVLTGGVAGAVVLALPLLRTLGVSLDPAWFIVLASLTGATLASVVFRER